MRIVGGTMRGRPLAGPAHGDMRTRPTTDRARESLFNIITNRWPHVLDETRVIDLFAGTGALGIEALSRGARFALFVEMASMPRGLIRRNVETLQLQGVSKLFRRDATSLGPIGTMEPFDLAFLDPPYGKRLGEKALAALDSGGWLRLEALVVLEESAEADFMCPQTYTLEDERFTGQTVMRFLRPANQPGKE